MRIFGFLILLFCFGWTTYGQNLKLFGTVNDADTNNPIPGVVVSVRPAGESRIIRHAYTSTEGKFEISLAKFPENHVLHFANMGYAPKTISLLPERLEYNVQLSMQATELKEVVFNAPAIEHRSDTIIYHVENFAEIEDQTLADVLKRMPGISVEPSGQIRYQNQPVNRFYIEGRDMLGGRYGIATNNIHQQDVASVEVLENHQPIRALQDISLSDDPAINIRLREDAKARWVGTLRQGAGFEPLLWKSELAAMRFKENTQTLNIYKSNNTGDALAHETRAFSIDNPIAQFRRGYRLQNYVMVAPDQLRQIEDYRSRFNNTHLFSTNNLWGVGQHYDLTSQITYLNKRLTSDNATLTSYFLEDGAIVTDEIEHASSHENRLMGDITLTANTPTYYFKNRLFANMHWSDMDIQVEGTFPNSQEASTPQRQFSNDLEILKRSGNRAYTVNTFNLYQVKPHHLKVVRDDDVQHQHVETSAFYTNTNTALSLHVNPVTFSMTLGFVGVIRSLESGLTGVTDTLGRMNNDETMRYLNLYASPSLEFNRGSFESRLNMPLSFIPYRYADRIEGENQHEELFFVSPRLTMRYHVTQRLSASLMGSYVQRPVQEQLFHESLIMNNYRNLSLGVVDFDTGNSKSVSFTLRYRQPLRAVFWNASLSRSWNYSPYIANVYFLDPYLLNTLFKQDYNHSMWLMSGNVSKGADFINGMVSLRSSLSVFEGATIQNAIESPYTSHSLAVSPRITSRLSTWFNMSYEFSFSKNWLEMQSTGMQTAHQSYRQKISGNINPARNWYVRLIGEHYYNEITADQTKHFLLTDAEFIYRLPTGLEFAASVRNIFDQDVYAYTIHSGLRAINQEYIIRPRNVMASVFFRF